ncbi:glycosyltransferase family 4 protein [Sphingomonas sp. LHG3406-1]|uniref:glycosyltransferase family 4 protein n=1 Tax=Sphingomonas sp. LHG3406-1 TaxID=2804617 RepID=UPI00345DED9E
MRQGFIDVGCDVVDVFPLRPRPRPAWLAKKVLHRLSGEFWHWDREPDFLRKVSRVASQRISQARPDFAVAVQSQACAHLQVDVPLVLTHDQSFLELKSYFPFEPRRRSAEYIDKAIEQERLSFAAADLISFPSEQACRTVRDYYGTAPDKLVMVPWGGNLPAAPSTGQVVEMIAARRNRPVVLTAIGVHWQRKGGDTILGAYRALQARGLQVRLNLIGMSPEGPSDEGVRIFPFLDKSDATEAKQFGDLLSQTHFLIAPSRVEAFGHIFAEAAAYGVPAIASDVGGIPTSVEDGVNGRLLPLDSTGETYAEAIATITSSWGDYEAMAEASREQFEKDLNWEAFCRTIIERASQLQVGKSKSHTLAA